MLILLDRDGVINVDLPTGVHSLAMFTLLPRALEAIAALTRAGHTLCIVTNQSAVGRGWMSEQTLDEIHARLIADIVEAGGRISTIYAAIEAPDVPSDRRKPEPGMLYEAMAQYNAALHDTVFVGDATTDLEAAARAGCTSILVKTGKGVQTEQTLATLSLHPMVICADLYEAATHLLAHGIKPY